MSHKHEVVSANLTAATKFIISRMVELAYTTVSKTVAARLMSSNLIVATKIYGVYSLMAKCGVVAPEFLVQF